MSVTIMKNKDEIIIDHTPKEPFISPLERWIETYCKQCKDWGGKCRLEDTRGLTPMRLCMIALPLLMFNALPPEVPPILESLPDAEEEEVNPP